MTEPIFILGCHRSGTSVVAGLLYNACGVSMGELMPATDDNPLGYFEALGVVDAHRSLLQQMERDWTCPPSTFAPGRLDLSALQEQVAIHAKLPGVWAMKDPRSMFLLPAWSQLGVDRVRLVAVVRPIADTVRSIEKRDHIRQDRAEAIVEAYLRRLVEIAAKVPLPVIRFPGDGDSLIRQVRNLAASLELPWDEDAALEFFNESLVRNRSPLRDSSPTYDRLLETARYPKKVPPINLGSLRLSSEPEWPLPTHLGVRHAQHRNQLWEMAEFSTHQHPDVAEFILEGARKGGRSQPGVVVHQFEVTSPIGVGAALMREGLRPPGVIAHGLMAGRSFAEIEFFFRSIYVNTDPLAELQIDVPDPQGHGLLNSTPAPVDSPRPGRILEIATLCGWDHVVTERLSPGRSGTFLRKRILTDNELIPVVTDLIAGVQRIHSIDKRLAAIEDRLKKGDVKAPHRSAKIGPGDLNAVEAAEMRALVAERELERLRSRRIVKFGLALARPTRGLFRTVRTWKKSR